MVTGCDSHVARITFHADVFDNSTDTTMEFVMASKLTLVELASQTSVGMTGRLPPLTPGRCHGEGYERIEWHQSTVQRMG